MNKKLQIQLNRLDESRVKTIEAINAKGGLLSESAKISDFPDAISKISGASGSSLAIEQYFGMLDALGLQPITDEEIANTCDSIWKEIQEGRVPTFLHQSTLMTSVKVNKGDSPLENLFAIPEEINIYSMSNVEINNTLSTLWETMNA
jgi:hypothetical protein